MYGIEQRLSANGSVPICNGYAGFQSSVVGEPDLIGRPPFFFDMWSIFRQERWGKDSLLWGTGKIGDVYSYVIIDRAGDGVELISYYNDSDFSYYSRWLLSTIRKYHKNGTAIVFPMQ